MKVIQAIHSTFIPNTLLGLAGGIEYLKLKHFSKKPFETQYRTLRRILEYGKKTRFGAEHHFPYILEAKDGSELYRRYCECVSASEYEDYRPYINRMKEGEADVLFRGRPELYATTSGATGEPKWIPISKAYLKDIYGRMNKCWLFNFLHLKPEVFSGHIVSVVGKQVEGYTPDGTIYGSVSGFTQKKCPGFVRKLYSAPAAIFDIDDYTARNYAIMRMGIEQDITLCVAANPSTMVEMQHNVDVWIDEYIRDIENGTLSDKVDIPQEIRRKVASCFKPNPERAQELRGLKEKYGRLLPVHFWPHLQVLTTWKCGNTSIYLDKLEGTYPEDMLHQEFGYFSSECRAGLVLDDSLESSLFPHFHFYEFKKADEFDDPKACFYRLDELQPGERYCPFVTTFSGLYRYNMNDIVEASAPLFGNTPRIHMVQKVNGIVSITGEKLYEGQFIEGVNLAVEKTGLKLNFFAGYANLGESRYDWYFEFEDESVSQLQAESFAQTVDTEIKALNMEYAAKRDSFRLKDPVAFRLQRQAFDNFKAEILGRTGQDASRFKPNVLAQNEDNHKVMSHYTI